MSIVSLRSEVIIQQMQASAVNALLVFAHDSYLNAFLEPHAQTLRQATGFSGSSGMAILLKDAVQLFTDGRYTQQAREQVDARVTGIHDTALTSPARWMRTQSAPLILGFDSSLMPYALYLAWKKTLEGTPHRLKALAGPLFARHRASVPPAKEKAPAFALDPQLCGADFAAKRQKLQQILAARDDCTACLLCRPEEVCWLTNLRGSSFSYSPLLRWRALFTREGTVEIFTDEKVDKALQKNLAPHTAFYSANKLASRLVELAHTQQIGFEAAATPVCLAELLGEKGVALEQGLIAPLKAIKSDVEIKAMRCAHFEDGLALVEFLAWIEEANDTDEYSAARFLDGLRARSAFFLCTSFPTISASGPNGAIIHYRVESSSARRLQAGDSYLVDSGGHYTCGTTDVTRCIAIGKPGRDIVDAYTQVLRGHVGLSSLCFPEGTPASSLDAIARQHLWRQRRDYAHGTGHGVGFALHVHEAPPAIGKNARSTPLCPGMICSIEPGYYVPGLYGIRIENMVVVKQAAPGWLGFETLTMAPYARDLIDIRKLDSTEIAWIDSYHARIYAGLADALEVNRRSWLRRATSLLGNKQAL